ncbi:DUF3592 domain-containing protein [Bifidobacterium sp. 82T10]|uniref:DUF3592 domain-containing protein n=1 Tax=Bifidobacterium miconis TaxID=2834435 RepID=A0ABS6WGZ5_9BIFI|nr:DUF3592 domain-containing protein [Bifidobacterium miconis]MBW3093329.1 DUF3592 domain-containing protein [Bifidobacterium miconis]
MHDFIRNLTNPAILVPLAVGGFFFLVGLLLTIANVRGRLYDRDLHARCTEEIMGTARVDEGYNGENALYSPEIDYQVAGRTYTVKGTTSNNHSQWVTGSRVRVRFDPLDPQTAWLPDDKEDFWLEFGLFAFGALFTLVGGVSMVGGILSGLRSIR